MENTMMNNVEEAMETMTTNMPATTEDIIDESKKIVNNGKGCSLLKFVIGAAAVFVVAEIVKKKIKKNRNDIKDTVREVIAEEAAKEQASTAEAEIVSKTEESEED